MLIAQSIDMQQFQNVSGTRFQHQLYDEIAECYKKVAKVLLEQHIKNSLFAQRF